MRLAEGCIVLLGTDCCTTQRSSFEAHKVSVRRDRSVAMPVEKILRILMAELGLA
jgi:hypothetical protein